MKRWIVFLLSSLFLVLILCACGSEDGALPTSVSPTPTATLPTATPLSKKAYLPTYQAKMTQRYVEEGTATAVQWTQTPTITLTPTISPTPTSPPSGMFYNVEIASEMIWGQAEGTLLLLDYSIGWDVLLDLSTGVKTRVDPVQPLRTHCHYVAPNRLQIACSSHSDTSSKILILDHRGQITKEYLWKDTWRILEGWLNNDQIVLQSYIPPDYPAYQNIPTTLFNWVDEEETNLLPDYPGITSQVPFDNQGPFPYTGTIYSPNLKLVLYESLSEEGRTTVLWNREKNQEVARVPRVNIAPFPQWHSAGDQVVVVGGQEYPELDKKEHVWKTTYSDLFILSELGEVRQVTHLKEIFGEPTEIFSLGWSPDGKLIAFGLRADGSECASNCVGILEVNTGAIEFVAFSNYGVGFASQPTYALIWSPDSRQLLLRAISLATKEDYIRIIIFDVEQRLAYQVAINARIEGWLANP